MPKGLIVIEGHGPRVGAPWAPLVRVRDRPLLLHAHDALREAGAGSILVAGTAGALDAVRPALDLAAPGTVTLELPDPGTSGDALLAAADWLDGDDVIVHAAGGLLTRGAQPLRRSFAAAGSAADATVFFAFGTGGRVRRVTGVHVFSSRILDALAAVAPGPDGRSLLEAVDRLAAGGGRVRAAVLESWRSYEEPGRDRMQPAPTRADT